MNKRYLSFSKRLSRRILVVFVLTTIVVTTLVATYASMVVRTMATGYFQSELQVANNLVAIQAKAPSFTPDWFYQNMRKLDKEYNTQNPLFPRDIKEQYTKGIWAYSIVIGLIILAMIAVGLWAAYWVSRITIRHSTKPLRLLAESADKVAQGNFENPLPELKHHDEISQLRDSFGNMQQSLTQYIDQLKTTTAPKALIERMTQAIHAFVGDTEQSDDLTMLCLRYNK